VIAPRQNEADIEEIPAHLRESLHFVFVSVVGEVLEAALATRRARGYRVS
jgi:ATP-dependent Lon protease